MAKQSSIAGQSNGSGTQWTVPLNSFLFKIGKSETRLCQACRVEHGEDPPVERVDHFIFHCSAYINQRRVLERAEGRDGMNLKDIMQRTKHMIALAKYIDKTDRPKNPRNPHPHTPKHDHVWHPQHHRMTIKTLMLDPSHLFDTWQSSPRNKHSANVTGIYSSASITIRKQATIQCGFPTRGVPKRPGIPCRVICQISARSILRSAIPNMVVLYPKYAKSTFKVLPTLICV